MQVFGHPNHIYKYVKKKKKLCQPTQKDFHLPRAGMKWTGMGWEQRSFTLGQLEPLTTRNPRRENLTLAEYELSFCLFQSCVSSVYNIIFHFLILLV